MGGGVVVCDAVLDAARSGNRNKLFLAGFFLCVIYFALFTFCYNIHVFICFLFLRVFFFDTHAAHDKTGDVCI